MSWFKLDDGFFDHPKVVQAGRDARDLWLAAGCYCARELTDGFVPVACLKLLAAKAQVSGERKLVARLVGVRGPSGFGMLEERPDGYAIHDYLKYNPSRVAVLAEREAARRRLAKWRDAKRGDNTDSNVSSNDGGNAVTSANPVPLPRPVPHDASTHTSRSLQKETARAPDADAERAREFAVPKPGQDAVALAERRGLEAGLVAAFHGASPPNKAERDRVEQAAGLLFESRVGVDELPRLIGAARDRWSGDVQLTPMAVARNVSDLRATPKTPGRSSGGRRVIADPIEEARARIAARHAGQNGLAPRGALT